MRMAVRPCHTVAPAQHVPSACTPAAWARPAVFQAGGRSLGGRSQKLFHA